MAAQTQERGPARKDPPRAPRHFDGGADWTRIAGKDPGKHYVGVNNTDEDALAKYQAMGYVPCKYTKGGVRWASGVELKEGDLLQRRGITIFEVSRERYEEIQKFGPDGQSGQQWADELENRILDKRQRVQDLMRGCRAPGYIRAESHIGEVQEEH